MVVGLSVFLLSVGLFMGVLYQYFGNQLTRELENEAWLVARGVEAMGESYLDGLHSSSRITWVGADGTVLYDNVADPAVMENHAGREEIMEALRGGRGVAKRESATLAEKTFYVAKKLEDGSVIRLASAQYTIIVLLLSMTRPLLIILVLAMILAAVLAFRLSKRLIQPILELDLERPEDCDTYDELAPLLTRIRRQNDTIREQIDLLRQRKREFEALTDNMSEGFVLVDRRGHILSYNPGALRLFGLSSLAEGGSVLALDRSEPFLRAVDRALGGQQSQGTLEREGRQIQLLANPVLLGQEAAGAVLVLLDVTEREQGERMRREFTANVSHELKTPLTAISGMAEIIQNGLVRPEDIAGFAGDIYKESQRLIALVEDILRLSRLDEGGPSLTRRPVDLLEVGRQVAQRMAPLAQKAGVSLTVEGESLSVEGVPEVLDEMLGNLCDNAIKYNRPGGSVVLSLRPGERGGVVEVRDTGIGIPSQDRERVFERFYRVDKSHSKEIGGTGLGLSIVKQVVLLHGGDITVSSEEEKGSTFTVELPMV